MKKNFIFKSGFTLVELLALVVIISAVASFLLPRYKLAKAKAQLLHYGQLVEEIAKQQEVYYAHTGKYATDVRGLDIPFADCVMDDSYEFKGNQYRCGKNIFIDNGVTTNRDPHPLSRGWVSANFCPNANKNFDTCRLKRKAHIVHYFQKASTEYNGKKACGYYTPFGKKLCQSVENVVDFYAANE